MEVRYSKHLAMRLKMRGIIESMPRIIFERARQRFFDTGTNLEIAVLKTNFSGKMRDVMIAYRREGSGILVITIHPLKSGQLENRIRSGRWRKLQ